jgi:hypothetical protein
VNDIVDFYRLISYLVTSARGCVDEPKMYGPFRLVDASKRLIDLLEARGLADDFLRQLRIRIDKIENMQLEDEKRFVESLELFRSQTPWLMFKTGNLQTSTSPHSGMAYT